MASDPAVLTEPTPIARPRVWPVFLLYAGMFLSQCALGVAIVFSLCLRWMLRHPETLRRSTPLVQRELVPYIHAAMASFWLHTIMYLAGSAIIFGAAILGWKLSKEEFGAGLRTRASALSAGGVAAGILGAYAVSSFSEPVLLAMKLRLPESAAWMLESLKDVSPGRFVVTLVVISLLPGVAEELFFRGYVQTRLSRRWGRWPAILVTAALFGLVHLSWFGSIHAFLMGVFVGWIVERGGSVRPAMAAHVFNNAAAVVSVAAGNNAAEPAGGALSAAFALLCVAAAVAIIRAAPGSPGPDGRVPAALLNGE